MYSSLSFGVACARKSSTPASAAMAAAVSGLSPVIMTRADAHRPQLRDALLHAALDDVLQVDDARAARAPSATASGVPPVRAIRSVDLREVRPAPSPPRSLTNVAIASVAPFRSCAAVDVDAAHPRVGGERDERAPIVRRRRGRAAGTSPSPAPRSSGLPASRRPGWTAARHRPAPHSLTPSTGRNSTACRLPSVMVPVLSSSSVFTSPAASTALPLMASTLCCITRSMPAMPIADSRPPIVVGIRQTSSETSTATRRHGARRRLRRRCRSRTAAA